MTTPTPHDIEVALDALEADAVGWSAAAADLRGAAQAAVGVPVAVSAFSFAGQSVAASYDELRSKMETLLSEGADSLDAIATGLRASAAAYAADEAANAHAIQNIY